MVAAASNALKAGLSGGGGRSSPVWPVSYVADLSIRFEEFDKVFDGPFFDGSQMQNEPPPAASLAGGAGAAAGGLLDQAAALLRGGLAGTAEGKTGADLGVERDGDKVVKIGVPVLNCTWGRNSYNEADTLSLDVPLAICPINPLLIRAIEVILYGGRLAPGDFMRAYAPGSPWPPARVAREPQNRLFLGFADRVTADERAGSFRLECRDYTGLLLDEKVPPHVIYQLDLKSDVKKVVKELLSIHPSFAGLQVKSRYADAYSVYADDSYSLPAPADFAARTRREYYETQRDIEDANKKGKQLSKRQATPREVNESYWGFIENMCLEVGVTPSVELDTLWLEPSAAALDEKVLRSRPDYKRKYRDTAGNEAETRVPLIVLDWNASDVVTSRSLLREATAPIECRAVDRLSGEYIKGRCPDDSESAKHPEQRGVKDTSSNPRIVCFSGDFTEDQLKAIAADLRYRLSRKELEISFSTSEFDGEGDNPAGVPDPVFLFLRSGDPVRIVRKAVGSAEDIRRGASTTARFAAMDPQQAAQVFIDQGYDPKVANTLAAAALNVLPDRFMVDRIEMSYDHKTGTKFDFTCVDFVDARKPQPPGEDASLLDAAGAAAGMG